MSKEKKQKMDATLDKLAPVIVAVSIFLGMVIVILLPSPVKSYHEKYEGYDFSTGVDGIGRENTYHDYLSTMPTDYGKNDISVDITKFNILEGNAELLPTYESTSNVLMAHEQSLVEFEFSATAGLYEIEIEYFTVPSKGIDFERAVYVNGEIPFTGADFLSLSRVWTDKTEVTQDNRGNDIRPTQVESHQWTSGYLKDYMGYEANPYKFYFEDGTNTIAIECLNEVWAIKAINIKTVNETHTYAEYASFVSTLPNNASNFSVDIQGESPVVKSSPSLYGLNDRTSPSSVPYSTMEVKLNMIGGDQWRVPGQWADWEFEVPEDGFYNITIKGRQNYQRGFVSNRTIYIDGQVPFYELEAVPFSYTTQWNNTTLGYNEDETFDIYLEAGKHTLRLEATLGELGDILTRMEESVFRLNEVYRKILVLTGASPDVYRDYEIQKIYPEIIEAFDYESKFLYKLIDDMVAYSGEQAGQAAVLLTLATQLEDFVENPYDIAADLDTFKTNVSAIGTTMLTLTEVKLDVDFITVSSTDVAVESADDTFWEKVEHELKLFYASYVVDYNSLGSVYEGSDVIDVWLLSGRDQSNILKTMIDDSFTPETGIGVNVKLVSGSVLNAIVAGRGPDVLLSASRGIPVEWALRGAVEDLTQFDDFDNAFQQFYPSSYGPFTFEGGVYGMPETQGFDVLFYRTDIMDDLELDIPETWDDVIDMLPVIQQNNMHFGIPTVQSNSGIVTEPSMLLTLVYQYGGQLYTDDKYATDLSTAAAVTAFEQYTQYFTHYDLPSEYNFVNRFRSGETPIGIAGYATYNTLSVFAPEIRGLWDFTLVPGVQQEDGTITRTSFSSGTSSLILKQDDETILNNSWEFLKWWGSEEIALRFGREMESILGAAARYATANKNAFESLPWSTSQKDIIREQWEWVETVPEIAGGYYTFRHLTNAVRNVINNSTDPRETLLEYSRKIDDEITRKRLELNLSIS